MITLQDLIDRFGERELVQLTNEQPRQDSVIDLAVVTPAIDDAVGKVASYLRPVGLVGVDALGNVVYTQSDDVPSELTRTTCDIARYYLYDNGVTETVETRFDDAIKWLDKVKKDPSMLTGQVTKPTAQATVHVIPNPEPNLWGN
jgi:phage gp36-like protein